ncbi:hypothetical protein J7E63_26795 [Bacillus sp. ISL-75]|uniref:hypothetical protein n=1 Tax=Bacillus sp. ISL-75 TaxID=2819137 RepID=UPI001BE9EC7D|nr:hypothetical protein [Bacillus sp. ISL-75]MBT2730441.1 hypothetical protein [Bacillus sp. ISL-75]
MRKILLLLSALTMALGLAACSSKEEDKTEKKETKEASAPEIDVNKEMVKFYMNLGKKINAKDADLNSYEAAVAKEAEDPDIKIEPEQKTKASESAAAVVAELNSVQVPASLKDQKADLEGAVKDFTTSYQVKAEELKKDAPSFDAAEAAFTQGEKKLGKAYESVKLLPPSLGNQVN